MFQKVFRHVIFFSPFWNITSGPERHIEKTLFSFTVAQKLILNDSLLVFKFFVFF